jgi:hypothetical protein
VFDRLEPKRQVRTDAHRLVEMSLMQQTGKTLRHLINLSGHSETGYFEPIPMGRIRIEVAGAFRKATSVRSPGALAVAAANGYTAFTISSLKDYELIVLE